MTGKTKYLAIENDIIEKIGSGVYEKGSTLPTEYELMDLYDCSRVTVRKALGDLQYMGYIERKQGSGSTVTSKQKLQSPGKVKSLYKDMGENDIDTKNEVLEFSINKADKTISDVLNISLGAKYYSILRLRYADKHPIIVERKYISVDLFPCLSYESLKQSIYGEAEKHGLIVDQTKCSIIPTFPDEKIADLLQISIKLPILKINTITYLDNGGIFSAGEEFYNPEYYQFNVTFGR